MPHRAVALLAYLLLHRGRPLARDAVAFDFWPDLAEPEARTKLRAHLRYLVALLPAAQPPWLLADKRTVQWNPEAPVDVDVLEYERLAQNSESAALAAELYSGELLAGHEDDWIGARRTALRERQITLLLALIERSRSGGERTLVNRYAQALLRLDPWREDAVRAVIEVRAESGDRAGALLTYTQFAHKLKDELGIEPMAATTKAYDDVRAQAEASKAPAALAAARSTNNLPAYLTSFVGREMELEALRAALFDRRLVTLIGPGGVGKTRLAVETARGLSERFPDGIRLVELAAIADDGLVPSLLAAAIGVVDSSENGLAAALRERRLLLVLDNCEHLPMMPRLVELLLHQCPQLRILATSREPLRVEGERIERIASLRDAPAVQLFLDRVADVCAPAANDASEEARRALVTIAQRLDGLPLAIELAAARAGTLTLSALAKRLDQSFAFLTGGSRAALPRHQTLRATIDWSYDSLDPIEQRVFARAGIFAGGWELPAAVALCADLGLEPWELQDRLASLADKSLVLAERSAERIRYRLLETMRSYALEMLYVNGEHDSAGAQHARYYAALAREDVTRRSADLSWFTALKPELQNLRAALRWTLELGNDPALGTSLAVSLAWFANTTPLCVEALARCGDALAALGANVSKPQEAALALARGRCLAFLQSHSEEFAFERRAVELFRELDDAPSLAYALSYLADGLWRGGRAAEAAETAEEASEIARRSGDVRTLAHALSVRARVTEDLGKKRELFVEAMDAYRSIDARQGVAKALLEIGECTFKSGDADGALRYANECIAGLQAGGEDEQHLLAIVRSNAAAYAIALGRHDEARIFASDALALANQIGDRRRAAWALQHLAVAALGRGEPQLAARLFGASEERLRLAITRDRSFTERLGYDELLAGLARAFSTEELEALVAQ
ncbi:MAG TPA: BTAD domain-containing putative transcriptional regulator, partial [Candidatus Acidoferrales bacterium]|nr:BTAD domain-containing putative transcriptional regulator [Candidatus Acidoferrales bacterium]